MVAILLAFQGLLRERRIPLDLSARVSRIAYHPVRMQFAGPTPARIAGAWALEVDDARLGGVSGLAIDGGRLLALTDAGMVAWLDLPEATDPHANLRALPAAAGDPRTKIGRDSEAIARDPRGRGWWVAFEQIHSLLLFDARFERRLATVAVGQSDFKRNRGIEAIAGSTQGGIVALPESTGVSDAVRLADGRLARIARRFTPLGFRSSIEGVGKSLPLPFVALDNPEAIAAAPLATGGTRLWIMTDNDFREWRPTLLVAIDLPPTVPTRN